MNENPTTALETALAYHRGWTTGDLDAALTHVADDVVCHAPPGSMKGAAALRAFMGPFAGSLTGSELLAAYGDEDRAVLVYDTSNRAVPSAPAAELYRVQDHRIVEIRIIFDRLPFALARGDVIPT